MPETTEWIERILDGERRASLLRTPRIRSGGSTPLCDVDGRQVVVMSSNDYLGLSVHAAVRRAASSAATQWGVGATGSRHLSGCHDLIEDLERELRSFEESGSAVLAPTGYAANMAALQALGGPDAVVFSDALNHASIVDGCRASRSHVEVYRHRDLDDLEGRLRGARFRPVIISDAVFSIDGSVADVQGLAMLAKRYGAWLILDEAHATGVLGPGGRGAAAAAGLVLSSDYLVRTVTLSKALGAGGGAICASPAVRRLVLQRGRALIYSTALPLPTVAAAQSALRVLREQPSLVDDLRMNARTLRESVGDCASPGNINTPIVSIIVGEAAAAVAVEARLWRMGYLVQALRPPTVPAGTSRLRAVASATHSQSDLRAAGAAMRGGVAA